MLQKIGDSLKGKKTFAWLILVPLAFVFALWGATGAVSLDIFGPQNYAAKVNGERIEINEANRIWQTTQSEWAQQFGVDIPEEMRTSLQDGVIERLIRQRLLTLRSFEAGYRVSAERLQQAIRSEEAFQVDGQYSETLALARLAQIGLSADQYRADIRKDLQNEQLQRALFITEFMTPTEIGRRLALEDEQREVRIAIVPAARFRAGIRFTEPELEAWYQQNSRAFLTTESVRLEYAELTLDEVATGVVVADADLQTLYAQNRERYLEPELRRARHILLADEATAVKLTERVKKGEDFAALAKEFSTDRGSAEQGGDLGFSEKSVFVGAFGDAVFAMREGEIRGPVKSEFGFHVIRLEAIQGGQARSFDELKADLAEEFKLERAADLYGEKLDQAQRRIEQPGAVLAEVAKEIGLRFAVIDRFERNGGAEPFTANPELTTVIFGDAVLNQRRIGGPVSLGDDRFVIVRVLEHRKPQLPPLAEVRASVLEAATLDRASQAARAAAETAAATMAAEGGAVKFDEIARGLGVTAEAARFVDRRDPSVGTELRQAAFAMPRPAAGKVSVRAVPLAEDGAAVLLLSGVRSGVASSDDVLRRLRVQQFVGRQAQSTIAAYIEEMRRSAKIVKNAQAFQQ